MSSRKILAWGRNLAWAWCSVLAAAGCLYGCSQGGGPADSEHFPSLFTFELVQSSLLGGQPSGRIDSCADERVFDAAPGPGGEFFITGLTQGGFPVHNAYQDVQGEPSPRGQDGFICKFLPNGSLAWATYLGGGAYDYLYGIASTPDGGCCVSGKTYSADFPGLWPGLPLRPEEEQSAGLIFAARLDAQGQLLWTAPLPEMERVADIAIDPSGRIFVLGTVFIPDIDPLHPPQELQTVGPTPAERAQSPFPFPQFPQPPVGTSDLCLVELNGQGRELRRTTLGGGADEEPRCLAVAGGKLFAAGLTMSEDFPTSPPLVSSGSPNLFVMRLDAQGGGLEWSRLVGVTVAPASKGAYQSEYISGLAVDGALNLYAAGVTCSPAFPLKQGWRMQPAEPLGEKHSEGFLMKLSPAGELAWSTLLDGIPAGVCLGPQGVAVAGNVDPPRPPFWRSLSLDAALNWCDAAAWIFSPEGQMGGRVSLGGKWSDCFVAAALSPSGLWLAGHTESVGLPLKGPLISPASDEQNSQALVVRYDVQENAPPQGPVTKATFAGAP